MRALGMRGGKFLVGLGKAILKRWRKERTWRVYDLPDSHSGDRVLEREPSSQRNHE